MHLKTISLLGLYLWATEASCEQVNIAYAMTENNYKQVFTSALSLLWNYDDGGRGDHINIFTISLNGQNLNLSPVFNILNEALTQRRFTSWTLQCIPVSGLTGDYLDEVPKFMLGEILPPEIDRAIFLRAETLVIRNLRPLWEEYSSLWEDDPSYPLPYATVLGKYITEDPVIRKQRRSIGCMLANLAKMRNESFSDLIGPILSRHGDRRFSSVDQAMFKYQHSQGVDQPVLNIRFDAFAESIPSRKMALSYSPPDPSEDSLSLKDAPKDNKFEEFWNLTVISFAGLPFGSEFLDNPRRAMRKWPVPKWIRNIYLDHFLPDIEFPGVVCNPDEPCDDRCDCEWCALGHGNWFYVGEVNMTGFVSLIKAPK
ncbi:MAG: hypothetical protein LBJ77_02200 [Holosporales bacterium]|jgi:hypothetical protein|nr:hypothetical protein [Holosporales bacterium]